MKLCMSLLAKYLAKYQPESYIKEDEASIKGLRFLSDSHTEEYQPQSKEYVYLGRAGDFFHDKRYKEDLLLNSGQNQVFCQSGDYETLLNDVLSAWDYYGNLEQQLIVEAGNHGNLENMIQITGQILDSPVLVFSIEGSLLAAVHLDLLTDESIIDSLKKSNTIGFASIAQSLVDRQGNIHHDLGKDPLLLHPVGQDSCAISLYLHQQEERVGFMMIFPSSSLEENIGLCYAKSLAGYYAKASEFHNAESLYQAQSQALLHLLSGVNLQGEVINRLQYSLDLQGSALLFVLHSLGIHNPTLKHLLMNDLQHCSFPNVICDYNGSICILTGKENESKLLHFLNNQFSRGSLSMGISMPIQKLQDMPVAFNQAYFALTIDHQPGIRYCNKLALPYLMGIIRENELATQMGHPAISLLASYDSANNTELSITLAAYIRNGCKQNETAKALHIHLNSLKYRIKRIEELTQIDFKNVDECFYLRVSLELI